MRVPGSVAALLLFVSGAVSASAAQPRLASERVAEAQQVLGALLDAGRAEPVPGSAVSKLDDRLTELRREMLATGPPAVSDLLAEPTGEHHWDIRDWQIETIVRMGEAAVPALAEALRSPDPQVRSNAYWCLEQMRAPAAKRALLAAAEDPRSPLPGDLTERPFYFPRGLVERVGGGEALLRILKLRWGVATSSLTGPERAEMARPLLDLLVQYQEEKRQLEEQLRENTDAQATIINGLGEISDPALVDDLIPALRDSDSQAWHAAMFALMQMGPAVAGQTANLLSEGTPGMRIAALRVMQRVGVPEEAYPTVVALLDDSDDSVYLGAAVLLPRMRPERIVPMVLARLAELSAVDTDHSREVRTTLVRALGQLGDPRAVPPLMEILTSDDEPVRLRGEALQSLGWMQAPGLGEALERLLSKPGNEWVLMEGDLGGLPVPREQLVGLLLGVLQGNGDPEVRIHVALALGTLRDPSAVPALMETAKKYWNAEGGGEPAIGSSCAAALGKIGDPRAVPLLIELVTAGTPTGGSFPQRAVIALGKIGDARAQPVLRKLLSEAQPGSWQQRYLAVALGDLGDGSVAPILKECMKAGLHGDSPSGAHYMQTEEAAQALVRIGEPAVPVLLEALDWRYEHTADYACLALAEIGDRRAVEPISRLLGSRSYHTRHHAAVALGKLGDPSAVPALRRALEDEDAYVRVGAAEALWQLGEKMYLPVIEKALAEAPEDRERAEAAAALGRMGAGEEALQKALGDPAFEVRQAAQKARGQRAD